MLTIYYTIIFILWTMFWSFSSVIISRLKSGKKWILTWRSECPNCKTKLKTKDLFPIFSYLLNKWKCSYCKTKISTSYIIYEILMGIIFVFSAYFFINSSLIFIWDSIEIYKLIFFLLIWFFSFIYIVYDIKYLEIPDSILAILTWILIITLIIQSSVSWFDIIHLYKDFEIQSIKTILLATWLSIFAIIVYYLIMLWWLSEKIDLLLLFLLWFTILLSYFFIDNNIFNTPIWSWLIWSFIIFLFFFLQIFISKWQWMWWWDLRIAIFIWFFVWISFIIPTILIVYMLWSIIWILYILLEKAIKWNKNLNSQIPFWPFLWIWLYIVLIYNYELSIFINSYF